MRADTKSCYLRIMQKAVSSPDRNAHNEEVYEWEELRRFWGKLSPISGREAFASETRETSVSHRIWADYYDLDGVTDEMIILFDPTGAYDGSAAYTYFDIEAVLVDHAMRGETELRVAQKDAEAVE